MKSLEPTAAEQPGRRRGRRTLILVAALFMLPVVISTVLYLTGWRPDGRSLQYGELLAVPRPIGDAALTTAAGGTLRLSELQGRWALVVFDRLPCDARCQANLYSVQQVRLAQGRDARRVERLFIALAPADAPQHAALAARYPGLQVLHGAPAAVSALAREFATADGTALDGLGRVYVIDPNGNLVMSYPPGADPSGMRKDLARLLRLSQIG
jgi:cytochrome oxidase Cu insertion factor (SCO1/SenC/PrrC family)